MLVKERDARRGAEAAEESTAFVADMGTALDTALEYEQALEEFARIAVPRLGDFCVIDVLEDDGTIHREAAAHADPEKADLIEQLRDHYPADPEAPQGLPLTIRTGQSQLIPEVTQEMLDPGQIAQDDEHSRIMRELGFRSAIVVPLRAPRQDPGRGRHGALGTAARGPMGPRTSPTPRTSPAVPPWPSTTRVCSPRPCGHRRS